MSSFACMINLIKKSCPAVHVGDPPKFRVVVAQEVEAKFVESPVIVTGLPLVSNTEMSIWLSSLDADVDR